MSFSWRLLVALMLAAFAPSLAYAQSAEVVPVCNSLAIVTGYAPLTITPGGVLCTSGATSTPAGAATIGNIGILYPAGSTAINASTTGTTGATTATLAGTAGKTTYICSFSIRANATAAATADSTVTGTISTTLHYTQWTAPLASGIGITEETFDPCIPASAANTAISVISAAPGAGGVVSVTAVGYQL